MKISVILYFFPNHTQSPLIEYSEELQVLAYNDVLYISGKSENLAFLGAASWDALWSVNTDSINEAQSFNCYNLKIIVYCTPVLYKLNSKCENVYPKPVMNV